MPKLSDLANLKGLITPSVGHALYQLATQVPGHQAIVELGSYHGKSTCYLALGAQTGNRPHIYAVDAWSPRVRAWSRYHNPPNLRMFKRTLRVMKLDDWVTPVRGLTHEAALRYEGPPVGLLYVDADHSEQAVSRDYYSWRMHLAPGATVAFDDYSATHNPEVAIAVNKFCTGPGAPLVFMDLKADRLAVCKLR